MAIYNIETTIDLGMSHSGPVTADGEGTVELTDEEVDILVGLIREKKTTNVRKLDLENLYPDIYQKLDEAYSDMAYKAEERHWLIEGYYSHYNDYDEGELMDYCRRELGYSFEFNPEDHFFGEELEEYQEDPEAFEDTIYDIESKAFNEWLDDYVDNASYDQLCDLCYNHMNCDLDMDSVDYTVGIPPAIIQKAKQKK